MITEEPMQILGELLVSPGPDQKQHRRIILTESTAFVDQLLDETLGWVEASTVILTPGESGDRTVEAHLSPSGDEISLGNDFFLSLVEYSIAPYMPVVGPTLLTINGAPDLEAFLHDADRARETGQFPAHLVHPAMELASSCALGAISDCESHRMNQLFVSADGEVSCARNGRPAGLVSEGLETVMARSESMSCAQRCLGAVLDPESLQSEVADRPWLGLYLAVTRLIRANGLPPEETMVHGFGPDSDAGSVSTVASLIGTRDEGYAVSTSGRAVRVGRDGYRYLDRYVRSGSHDQALSEIADSSSINRAQLEKALDPLRGIAHSFFPELVGG